MATGDIAPTSGIDLASLVNLFTGRSGSGTSSSSGTTGNTSTTRANISDAGIKEMIDQILSGQGGIASIANAEKSAGLYGGSTSTLLTNNLITQTAAKLAAAQAGTTTTQTGNTTQNGNTTTHQDPTLNPIKTIGAVGGLGLLNGVLQGTGAGSIGDLIASGGRGIGSLISGLTGNGPTVGTDQINGQGVNNSGMTPQQIEAQVGLGAGTTTIPITSLFPSSDAAGQIGSAAPSWDFSSPEEAPENLTETELTP